MNFYKSSITVKTDPDDHNRCIGIVMIDQDGHISAVVGSDIDSDMLRGVYDTEYDAWDAICRHDIKGITVEQRAESAEKEVWVLHCEQAPGQIRGHGCWAWIGDPKKGRLYLHHNACDICRRVYVRNLA